MALWLCLSPIDGAQVRACRSVHPHGKNPTLGSYRNQGASGARMEAMSTSWMGFQGCALQPAFMLYKLCDMCELCVSIGITCSTTFAHSSHTSTGTRCCTFKMIYNSSTYTSCCQGFKLFGPMQCGVISFTFTSHHHAKHTCRLTEAYPLIEIETEGRLQSAYGSRQGGRLSTTPHSKAGAQDSQVLSYSMHYD